LAQYVILFFAVLRARAIVAPLNPAYTEEELEFYLEDSGSLKGKLACIHSFCHMVALTTNDFASTK
jgi:acyl-CoA synthetase (AMP-forming)/AMP-acid ligase II